MINIIAAISKNRIIGRNGLIPWDIPEDRQHFRETTTGHTVIMGRKTWESIGYPLPKRTCIVLSRNSFYEAAGCKVVSSVNEALELCDREEYIFVAGGSEIYKQFIPLADRIYLSVVDLEIEGDARFPELPNDEFVETSRRWLSTEPATELIVYDRINRQTA